MSGGGWCAGRPPDNAAWGLQGLRSLGHELWRGPRIPHAPSQGCREVGTVQSGWHAANTGSREQGCQPEGVPLPASLKHLEGCPGSGDHSRGSFSLHLASQSVARGPVALASPGHLFQRQTLSLFPDLLTVNLRFQQGPPRSLKAVPTLESPGRLGKH